MRRLVVIAVVLAGAVAAVLATGASGEGEPYRVRAIFLNAFSVIPGEDVKIAGVRVGQVAEVDVDEQRRAVLVLDITEPGFQDFRADATCEVRPQSLIGEKFVECTPTRPRADGAPLPPPLPRIARGPGKGQHLVPVSQTSKAVDLDLLNAITRLPQRQRLAVLLNELGTGLAARGPELRQAVRNANPALKETDRVVALLAEQDDVLQRLARDGDAILAPLARDRGRAAGFITRAAAVAAATAERGADIEAGLRALPPFLDELEPTMARLGALADEGRPALADARAAAPGLTRVLRQLGPFSTAATPALDRLGDASLVGRRALLASRPVIGDLAKLGRELRPVSADLADTLVSVRDSGGIERAMDFLFLQVAAINGFDQVGHYLRSTLIINNCSTYAASPQPGCSAQFERGEGSRAARAAARAAAPVRRSPELERTDALLDYLLGQGR